MRPCHSSPHVNSPRCTVSEFTLELRQIVRSLFRQPVFAATSIVTLGLGLGAAVAIVTIADRVLFRKLPYPRPDRLYAVSATVPGPDGNPATFILSPVEYIALRTQVPALEQMEAMSPSDMALTERGATLTVSAAAASAGFLRLFGLDPVIGRSYTEQEDTAGSRVAILDGGVWRRQFASDPQIVGRSVQLDGVPYEIIGVTAPGYQPLLQRVDVWVPLTVRVDPDRPGVRSLLGVARSRAEATREQAIEQIRAAQSSVARTYPATHGRATINFDDLHQSLYGSYRPALLLMLGGVMLLLVIACANVANLTVGRLAQRRAEMALRLALGASRARLMRHQLLESAVICTFGGTLGVALASLLLPALLAVNPDALPSDLELGWSARAVMIFAVLVGAAVLVSGIVPSWSVARTSLHAVRDAAARHGSGPRDRQLRRWLLTGQVAIAVLLVSIAAMVGTTLHRLQRTDVGLSTDGVLTMQLAPPVRYRTVEERAAFLSRVLEHVRQLPGVVQVGTTQTTWRFSMATRVQLEDRPLDPEEAVLTNMRHVTAGYFNVLGVAVLEGRAIDDRDQLGSAPVAVVSRAFAERMWPGRSAVGRRLRRTSPNAPWLTVVGVVKDVMDSGIGTVLGPTLYVPYLQQNTPTARIALVVRTDRAPELLSASVQKAIWAADPLQPIDQAQSLVDVMAASIALPRFRTLVLTAFGLAAVLLACVGAYGVAGFAATLRRREIGIRITLGAVPSSVTRLIVRDSLLPAVAGVVLGAGLAAISAPLVRHFLTNGESLNVGQTAAAAAVLLAVVAFAAWLPARRATRRDPMGVLRAG